MKYYIFIPVRLESTRLPKKQMKKIQGKPIIKYLVERLRLSKKIKEIVVCTTNKIADDPLVNFLESENIKFFRGNELDLLVRFRDAVNKFKIDFVVVVDGDDIYTDPLYVDKVVEEFEKTDADFICGEGFPHGFVPIGIKRNALEKICRLKISNNTATGYREFFTETNLFNCRYIKPKKDLKFPKNLRLTLDYEEDYFFAKEIFSQLGNYFHLEDIIDLLEKNPDLIKIIDGLDKRWKDYYKNNFTDLSLKSNKVS